MQQTQLKKILINSLKIGLGLLLLYLSFYRIDRQLFLQSLWSVSIPWLVLAIISVFISLALKVYRWRMILGFYQLSLPITQIIGAFFLGQAANTILIVRGGELVRLTVAHTSRKDDWLEVASTIIIEKYLDLLFLVFLMVIISTSLPVFAIEKLGALSPILILFTILLLLLVIFGPLLWYRYSPRFDRASWMKKFYGKLDQFVQASLWLRDPKKLLPLLAVTLLVWVLMAYTNILVFKSLSLSLPWEAAVLVLVLIYLGVLPALMPGNVGPFTYFAQLALIPFAVSNNLALAFAVILYSIVTLPPLIISGIYLLASINLRKFSHE